MSRMSPHRAVALTFAALALLACSGSDSTAPKSVAVSVSATTTAVTQGQTATVTVAVDRTNFTGDVALAASGLPNGVTASFAPATLSNGTRSSTLTFTAASSADTGTVTINVTASGTGIDAKTATVALTCRIAPNFSIAVNPTSLSVAQAGSGTATVTITRVGDMTGSVALVATGLPVGVTAAFSPASLDATTATSTLTLTAADTAVIGTSTITITGSSTGFTDKSATLGLSVTAAGFSIAVAPATLSLVQGANGQATLTVTRTGMSGAVTLEATGMPSGVTAAFSPATLDASTTSSTLTLTAAADAALGTGTITITGSSTGFANQTATLALTVTATAVPGFTIAASTTTLSVQQGANGQATITVARTGGMTGDVALAATGLPSGVTASFDPATVGASATTSTLTLTAASSAAIGTANVTITGTSAGFADQATTVALTVTQAASGTSIALNFCPNDVPTWVAYQNDDGAWTQTPVANNGVQFTASGTKLGLAMVFADAVNGTEMEVNFLTPADLSLANGKPCVPTTGSKSLGGSVAGLGSGQIADIGLGHSFTSVVVDGAFQLTNVMDGTLDLIGVHLVPDAAQSNVPNRVIVRRGVDFPNGATIPVLDFASEEALTPVSATLTIANFTGANDLFSTSGLQTANGTSMSLGAGVTQGHSATVYGLPTASQLGTDLYTFSAWATTSTAERMVTTYAASFGDQTANLGPTLTIPTITSVTPSTYLRFRVVLQTQAQYASMFAAEFDQTATNRSVALRVSASYMGSATAWDVTMPDLSGATGWDSNWALASGEPVDWYVTAVGANFDPYSEVPGDGATESFASQSSSSAIIANRVPLASTTFRAPSVRSVAPRFLQDRASFRLR